MCRHGIKEYFQMEETHEDHQAQLLNEWPTWGLNPNLVLLAPWSNYWPHLRVKNLGFFLIYLGISLLHLFISYLFQHIWFLTLYTFFASSPFYPCVSEKYRQIKSGGGFWKPRQWQLQIWFQLQRQMRLFSASYCWVFSTSKGEESISHLDSPFQYLAGIIMKINFFIFKRNSPYCIFFASFIFCCALLKKILSVFSISIHYVFKGSKSL